MERQIWFVETADGSLYSIEFSEADAISAMQQARLAGYESAVYRAKFLLKKGESAR